MTRLDCLRELARSELLDPCVRVDFLPDVNEGHSVVLRAHFTVRLQVPADMPRTVCRKRLREGYVLLANRAREHLREYLHVIDASKEGEL